MKIFSVITPDYRTIKHSVHCVDFDHIAHKSHQAAAQ